MSSEFSTLMEVANVIDSSHKTPTYVSNGIPMVRVTDVKYGELKLGSAYHVSVETFTDYSRRYRAKPRDIIISRVGSYGNTSWVADTRFCLGQNVSSISPEKIDPRYLYYVLNSPYVRAQIEGRVVGSTQKTLSLKAIKELKIPRKSVFDEKEIGAILGALDNRIELLHETNVTLEAMSRALFKSWFVDFDPVRAKIAGCVPEHMDEATIALFPNELEESTLGAVPKGWFVRTFRDTIDVISGGTPKTSVKEFWGGEIPWFSVVDAPNASDVFVVDTEKHITQAGLDGSSTKLLPVGTTIISARGTVGRLALTGRAMAMNQSCYGLRGKAGDVFFTYLSTTRLVEQLKQRAHGSVFDTITQETFSGISLSYPSPKLILVFEDAVGPLFERIKENLIQSQILADLRNTLLPRLISGQVRIPEVEARIEALAT